MNVRFFLVVALVLWCTLPSSAQTQTTAVPDTILITAAALEKGIRLDTVRVRFHAGDDMRWKERDFDDNAWQVVRNDTAGNLLPSGIGWFRIYFRSTPDIASTIGALNASVISGGAELYLDGTIIKRLGTPSPVAEGEVVHRETNLPLGVYVTLPDTGIHVLAVRMSRWGVPSILSLFGWMQRIKDHAHRGLSLQIDLPQTEAQTLTMGFQRAVVFSFACGVLVLLLLLQGYLYSLNPQDKASLYFALYLLGFAALNISHTIFFYDAFSPFVVSITWMVAPLGGTLSLVFLLCSVKAYFQKPISRRYVVFIGILAGTDITFNLWLAPGFISSYAFMFLCAEAIRSTFAQIYQHRKDINTWILGLAISLSCSLNFVQEIGTIMGEQILRNHITLLTIYTVVPLAITFVLVRRITQDRNRLARYSEDLERNVAMRTRELGEANLELSTANEEILRQVEIQAEQAREIELANTALQQAHEESEALLLNILPAPIAHRLKTGERAIADRFDAVTVLFADIVGFTKFSARTTPEELVQGLNTLFEQFDTLAKKYGLEKIKTIGDAYMVAGGLPERCEDHCQRVAHFALEMQAVMGDTGFHTDTGEGVQLRIGIHSGEAVAGVIGTSKFAYDLWGDTVNTASRMESHGEAGRIHCSEEVHEVLKDTFAFEERGEIEVKGKGVMGTWFLVNFIEKAQ